MNKTNFQDISEFLFRTKINKFWTSEIFFLTYLKKIRTFRNFLSVHFGFFLNDFSEEHFMTFLIYFFDFSEIFSQDFSRTGNNNLKCFQVFHQRTNPGLNSVSRDRQMLLER